MRTARKGGSVAGTAGKSLEKKTAIKVVTKETYLAEPEKVKRIGKK